MKYEIWEFRDDAGATWHLQDLDDRYEAFLRHVELEKAGGFKTSILHTFESESFEEAERFYLRLIGFESNENDHSI